MSRIKKDYENSLWAKLEKWIEGDKDPFENKLETKIPEVRLDDASVEVVEVDEERLRKAIDKLEQMREIHIYRKIYRLISIVLTVVIIAFLMWTVTFLPRFGAADNPYNNEVSERYIKDGLKETGAVNIVAGMILDYRAFDTFGESCVLFMAVACVMILLKIEKDSTSMEKKLWPRADDGLFEPGHDRILQKTAFVIIPAVMMFGVYVVLNGHLSPGGGFSGGAIIGGGLILYANAYGFKRAGKMFTEQTFKIATLCALGFYCIAKSYSFFTGANHLESHIPLGTPGDILSAGLILPLNMSVGIVVACTMYTFYMLFRKGGF